MNFNPCFLIPCYNHGATLPAIIHQLKNYDLPCLIVDDGSSKNTAEIINNLGQRYDWISTIKNKENLGKGGAVINGMKCAWSKGFTHVIQIDADGQHNLNDLPKLLTLSREFPQDLISGCPVFDDSVPKSRYYGRYITHIWVWIETLSFQIKDSMCGFRSYPLKACTDIIENQNLGRRMDFDTEIMVRLFWRGVNVRFFETHVIYPPDGVSHFNLLRDNLLISLMHTRLFFGMLLRIPSLISRKHLVDQHWSKEKERGSTFGIKFMLWTYKAFGRKTFNVFLYPVMTYFWLTGTKARHASQNYLSQIQTYAASINKTLPAGLNSYNHFLNFGRCMLDKIAAWSGDIKVEDVDFPSEPLYRKTVESGKGIVVIGSHLGNLELCRALGDFENDVKINSIVFTHHAERFNRVLKTINPKVKINLIEVSDMGTETAIMLKEKIDVGEWIVIVGDRVPQQINKNIVWANFLGEKAPFPQGPFVLASLLKCPIYLMFGLNETDNFRVHFEFFSDELVLPRGQREKALEGLVQEYANRLSHYCVNAPLDWFNFFDFWKLQDGKKYE